MRQYLHSGGGLLPQLQELLIALLNFLVQALQEMKHDDEVQEHHTHLLVQAMQERKHVAL